MHLPFLDFAPIFNLDGHVICVSVSNITCNMQKINATIATKFDLFQDISVQPCCDLKCLIIKIHSFNFIKFYKIYCKKHLTVMSFDYHLFRTKILTAKTFVGGSGSLHRKQPNDPNKTFSKVIPRSLLYVKFCCCIITVVR